MPAHVAQFMADHPPDPIGIWPCNLKTVALFRQLTDCFRFGAAGPVCLDIPSVKIVAKAMKVRLSQKRLMALSAMASVAVTTMRERCRD